MKQNMTSLANINFDTLYVDCFVIDCIIEKECFDSMSAREYLNLKHDLSHLHEFIYNAQELFGENDRIDQSFFLMAAVNKRDYFFEKLKENIENFESLFCCYTERFYLDELGDLLQCAKSVLAMKSNLEADFEDGTWFAGEDYFAFRNKIVGYHHDAAEAIKVISDTRALNDEQKFRIDKALKDYKEMVEEERNNVLFTKKEM